MSTNLLKRYHKKDGNFIILILSKGTKWIRYTSLESFPLREYKVLLEEEKYFKSIVTKKGEEIDAFLKIGARLGMFESVRRQLEQLKSETDQ